MFIHELINKLVPILRMDNFKLYSLDCSDLINGTTDLSSSAQSEELTLFETRLTEIVAASPILQFYQNSTFNIEYYLKMMVFGRDGNELRLMADESPVLTELAMIDNSVLTITPNVSLKAPRRFFRIGVSQVNCLKTLNQLPFQFWKKTQNFVCLFFIPKKKKKR